MRDTFPGYYRPTEDEFSELWANCIFVPDANVLLSLYELSARTAEKLEEILAEFCDRDQLWTPHQAALEYQRHRRGVIEAQAKACDSVKDLLDNTQRKLTEICQDRRPPFPQETGSLLETVETAFAAITERLEAWKQERLTLLDADAIRDTIDRLLEGRVGPEYPDGRLAEIYKEAELRYRRRIPPGYRAFKNPDPESNREDLRQYGDVVLWFQVIDHATETEKPIVIVTNEGRDDWWEKSSGGQTIGPRPELIHEMRSNAGVPFYMYRIEQFIQHAGEHLEVEVREEVLDEARDLGRSADLWTLRNREMLRTLTERITLPYEEMVRRLAEQPALRYAEMARRLAEQPGLYAEMLERWAQQPALRYAEMQQGWAEQTVLRYNEMARILAQYPYLPYNDLLRALAEQPVLRYQELLARAPEGLAERATSEGVLGEEESAMTYQVYENWTVRPDKAIIHRSDCRYANGGPIRSPTKNGRWYGPFATYREAFEVAQATGREDVRPCKHCKPG